MLPFPGGDECPSKHVSKGLAYQFRLAPYRHAIDIEPPSKYAQSLTSLPGYNFKSLQEIVPFLEPSRSGISSLWARTMALKYDCTVVVGYPEKVDLSQRWPTGPEYYNSAIVVNGDGDTIANYRKSFLYYTDETWALEGNGFYNGWIPGAGKTAIGICKCSSTALILATLLTLPSRHGHQVWTSPDYSSSERLLIMYRSPYKFEAPWNAYEFAFHILEMKANLVVLSMAWITRDEPRQFSRMPNEPDINTLTYWVARLEPVIRAETEDEIIVVFCNRTGAEGDATYAGTSAVIGVQAGEVRVYGLLGRGQKELLVVDTSHPPFAKLVHRNESEWTDMAAHEADQSQLPKLMRQSTKTHHRIQRILNIQILIPHLVVTFKVERRTVLVPRPEMAAKALRQTLVQIDCHLSLRQGPTYLHGKDMLGKTSHTANHRLICLRRPSVMAMKPSNIGNQARIKTRQ